MTPPPSSWTLDYSTQWQHQQHVGDLPDATRQLLTLRPVIIAGQLLLHLGPVLHQSGPLTRQLQEEIGGQQIADMENNWLWKGRKYICKNEGKLCTALTESHPLHAHRAGRVRPYWLRRACPARWCICSRGYTRRTSGATWSAAPAPSSPRFLARASGWSTAPRRALQTHELIESSCNQ